MSTAESQPPPPSGREPEWTHDQCVDYESARECLTSLLAFHSRWIEEERQRPVPDVEKIAAWHAETARLAEVQQSLSIHDPETVARVRREYGAEVKRLRASRG
jgi:hypothetical protein